MKKLFYPLFILLCAAGSAHSLPSSHGINKTAPFVINEANGLPELHRRGLTAYML